MPDIEEHRAREIFRALSFYDENFTRYLATTISFTETLPEEINNQIRDAFSHLSRARNATSQREITRQVKLAISHIERANRDCLKASIIFAREELDELIADATFIGGFLTPTVKQSYKSLKEKRRSAYQTETRGDDKLNGSLEEILRLTIKISDDIKKEYTASGKPTTRVFRSIKRWSRPIFMLVSLVLGTALGFVLKDYIAKLIALIW